ncbi:hypothetical protein GEMRC1_009829 [Eukaryota sp. GEM-RC1]
MSSSIPPSKMSRPSEDSGGDLVISSNQSLDLPLTTLLHEPFLKQLHFQESLLILIQLYRLRRHLSGTLRCHLSILIKRVSCFLEKAGYVSERFYKSSFSAVTVFFQISKISVSPEELPLLFSIASYFNAEVQSVVLIADPSFEVENILPVSSVVSELSLWQLSGSSQSNPFDSRLHQLLDHSSPFFLSRLTKLVLFLVSSVSMETFPSFCNSLMTNTTVIDLFIRMNSFSAVETAALSKVFCSNNTLTKLCLSCESTTKDADYQIMLSAISNNSIIEQLDISSFKFHNANVVLPILKSKKSAIKSLTFPSGCTIDCNVMNALRNNSSIIKVDMAGCIVEINDFVDVLKSNPFLKQVTITQSKFGIFSPIFKCLETNTSLVVLDLSDRQNPLTDQEVESLVKMLKNNNKILVLNLSSIPLSSSQFKTILRELKTSSLLRSISFSLSLNNLISYFRTVFSAKLNSLIGILPHSIDVSLGLISYQFKAGYNDLMSLLYALKSNIPIKRVEFCGLKSATLGRLVVIFEILSINKSVIDLDISPHNIDVENGVFRFSPEQYTQIAIEEV